MRWMLWTLSALLLVETSVVQAGIFDRKPKPSQPAAPAAPNMPSEKAIERVLGLINTLQNDKRAGKRVDAAEALNDVDAQLFPEVVPALVQAALKDPDSGVRREAVQSLGRIRPTSHEAAQALDQATKDDSYRVRLQARTSRLGYKVSEQSPPPVAEAGHMIKVPPPGPDGRLTPVAVPSNPAPAEVREETPVASPPPVVDPPSKPAAVSLAKPQPKSKATKEVEGPILVPPMR